MIRTNQPKPGHQVVHQGNLRASEAWTASLDGFAELIPSELLERSGEVLPSELLERSGEVLPSELLERSGEVLPSELLERSREVLYSGRGAFSRPSLVYLLGFNPGSESKPGPNKPKLRTVRENIEYVGQKPGRFSLYYEPWEEGRTEAMQVRMRHLFKRTGLDPCLTPASNCVFVRSRGGIGVMSQFGPRADSDTRGSGQQRHLCPKFWQGMRLKAGVPGPRQRHPLTEIVSPLV